MRGWPCGGWPCGGGRAGVAVHVAVRLAVRVAVHVAVRLAVRGVAVRGRPCGRPSGTGVAEEPKLRRLVGRGRSGASLLSLPRPARLRQRSECAARFSGAPGSEAESPRALGRMRVVLGRALRLKELLVSRHRSFLASAADPHRAEPATRCRGCSRVVSCSVYPVLSVCFAS